MEMGAVPPIRKADRQLRDEPLGPSQVNLWHVAVSAARATDLWSALSGDEQARAARFWHDADAQRFVIGRGVLRTLLARYADSSAAHLRFGYGKRGKPFLDSPPGVGLEFNVAHAGTWVLLAVTRAGTLGVDVEQIRPESFDADIATAIMTDEERRWLQSLPPADRGEALLRCWTLKEAYVKATGEGFEIAPAELCVLKGLQQTHMRIVAPDAQGRWLLLVPVGEGYCAAVAVPEAVSAIEWQYWSD